jgi:acyl carrier protein
MLFADMFGQFHWNEKPMIETIRRLIDEKGNLPTAVRDLSPDADLYGAGLTPLSAIQVMLALEKEFDIEFPEWMLNRQSMSSIDAIVSCLCELQEQQRNAPPEAA